MRTSTCVAILFPLLAVATSASAECAWVLWAQSNSEWSISDTQSNEDGCKAKMRGLVEGAKQTPKMFTVVSDNFVIVTGQDGKPFMSIRYVCLPDTVDPRGPKGGK